MTNSGKCDGAEVAQLYISPTDGNTNLKPIQLKGFQRVELKSGESRRVTMRFDPRIISYYDTMDGIGTGVWRVKSGEFEVKVGASSSDIRLSSPLKLSGEEISTPRREIYFSKATISQTQN